MPVMTHAPFELASDPEPLPPAVKSVDGGDADDQEPGDHDWLYEPPPPPQPDPIFAEGGATDYYYERLPEQVPVEEPESEPKAPTASPESKPAPPAPAQMTIEEQMRQVAEARRKAEERKQKEEEWEQSPERQAKLERWKTARRRRSAACGQKYTTPAAGLGDVAISAAETGIGFVPGVGTVYDLGKAGYHALAALAGLTPWSDADPAEHVSAGLKVIHPDAPKLIQLGA